MRRELNAGDITVIGLGDDALPVLLAAAVDSRIKRIAVVHHVHSFVPQMQHMPLRPAAEMWHGWNSPQLDGRMHAGGAEIDLGSVIPSALRYADLPDLVALIAPRKFLFCEARDGHAANFDIQSRRFQRIMESAGSGWARYEPDRILDGKLLLDWLQKLDNEVPTGQRHDKSDRWSEPWPSAMILTHYPKLPKPWATFS